MKRHITVMLVMVLGTSQAIAQQQTREEAIKAFSGDLAKLQETLQPPAPPDKQLKPGDPYFAMYLYNEYATLPEEEKAGRLERAIEQANEIVREWSGSNFIKIDGFTLSLGWGFIPSIDVNFSFKPEATPTPK